MKECGTSKPVDNTQWAFIEIAPAVMNMYDDDMADCYWVTFRFFKLCMKYNYLQSMPMMLQTFLKKEDPDLFKHLDKIKVLSRLPYNSWFLSVFAGVFPADVLARVWDRLIGGACKLLLYIALTLLTSHRKKILEYQTLEQIEQVISKVKPEMADSIVMEAIELWEKNGSHLRPEVT